MKKKIVFKSRPLIKGKIQKFDVQLLESLLLSQPHRVKKRGERRGEEGSEEGERKRGKKRGKRSKMGGRGGDVVTIFKI